MKALVTGASSGIGREFAKILSNMGYEIILVARRADRLEKLAGELKTKTQIIPLDLSAPNTCRVLYEMVQDEGVEILINNAGFGLYGSFDDTDIDRELEMIDVNVKALHSLTKLFLKDFVAKNHGYILNVASVAGFLPGPQMATYYATKNYVVRLTQAIREELRRKKSNVYIGMLCPGPVNTEFNDAADVKFALAGASAQKVAEYAVKKMFKRKMTIIPTLPLRIAIPLSRFLPTKLTVKICYNIQRKKEER